MQEMSTHHFRTVGGIDVYRAATVADYATATCELARHLNASPGVLLSSGFEFPGRYNRWDIGFADPPLCLSGIDRQLLFTALNERGEVLLAFISDLLAKHPDLTEFNLADGSFTCQVREPEAVLYEEQRTRQRSVFTVLRSLIAAFASGDDSYLGLYGAFGYELAFQFEAIQKKIPRTGTERNLVLYLPDTILVVDHQRQSARQYYYDFEFNLHGIKSTTNGLPRIVPKECYLTSGSRADGLHCDHPAGAYTSTVERALQAFRRGDLFETVPGQTFSKVCLDDPATVFLRLQKQNPAPYGALMNLGEQEYLVAASPEMYVRVRGRRVETCPISGTIKRGADALEDAEQIRTLLNSRKDEAELSMCTDVDRNDKSRICEPGSVRVIGRRQVELYSRLIHTVDHVEGILKKPFDALDAFLSHVWAVTVTGAPKQAAIQFIEDHERSPRSWYGGAMGCLNFNGDLNTGLTIRTIRLIKGVAEVRAGATLLADSDPALEEAETRLKAAALLQALQPQQKVPGSRAKMGALPRRVVMVDHHDSFVHTLSSCLQEQGAEVRTVRPPTLPHILETYSPDLVFLSPGPGRPADSGLHATLELCLRYQLPIFGVCLGLQGIIEYFGGSLRTLPYPVHGKRSVLERYEGLLFAGLQGPLEVGRYHSLVAADVPACLNVTARTRDGEVMAVHHKELPVAAVQFHPESILSQKSQVGRTIITNVLAGLSQGLEQVSAADPGENQYSLASECRKLGGV